MFWTKSFIRASTFGPGSMKWRTGIRLVSSGIAPM